MEQLRTTAFVCKKKTNQKSTIQQCTLMFRHNQQYKIQDTNKIQDQKNWYIWIIIQIASMWFIFVFLQNAYSYHLLAQRQR